MSWRRSHTPWRPTPVDLAAVCESRCVRDLSLSDFTAFIAAEGLDGAYATGGEGAARSLPFHGKSAT